MAPRNLARGFVVLMQRFAAAAGGFFGASSLELVSYPSATLRGPGSLLGKDAATAAHYLISSVPDEASRLVAD